MKLRILIFLACAATLSCKDGRVERRDDGPGSRINFSTQFTKLPETRGAILEGTEGLAADGGFDVWAFSHATPWNTNPSKETLLDDVMVTGTVSGNGVAWSYGTEVNWPGDQYVSFFAYGPAGSAAPGAPSSTGSPTVAFQVNPVVKDQVDFVITKPAYNQMGANYAGSKPVTLFFNHSLSRIVFSGIMTNPLDTKDVYIKSVELDGLYCIGSVDLGDETTVWDVDQTVTDGYTLTAGEELADIPLSSTATKLTTDDGYLFLMPQMLTHIDGPAPSMTVTIEEGGADKVHTSTISSPSEWLPGKSYNYQLVVDGGDLRLVLVSVDDLTLTDWNVEVMIQPVPLSNNRSNDEKRLYSALSALGHLNMNEDNNIPPPDDCKHFSIYLMNSITHDITISMDGYERMFTDGEYVMFDGRKIVGPWGTNSGTGTGYVFTVNFNPVYWTLEPALQNVSNPVDASTGATATATTTPRVTNSITTYGSVIVRRNSTPPPANP